MGSRISIRSKVISENVADPDRLLQGLLDSRIARLDEFAPEPLRVKDIYYSIFIDSNHSSMDKDNFPQFTINDSSSTRDRSIENLAKFLIDERVKKWTLEELSAIHIGLNKELGEKMVANYQGPLAKEGHQLAHDDSASSCLEWCVFHSKKDETSKPLFRIYLSEPTVNAVGEANTLQLTTGKGRVVTVVLLQTDSAESRESFGGKSLAEWVPSKLTSLFEKIEK